nr:hypothetical protein [Pseudomonadota bacterium]
LHTSVADTKIIELYERKMDNDDCPDPSPTENEIKNMVDDAMKKFSEFDMDESAIVEKLNKLELPVTEKFLNDLMSLIEVHDSETQITNLDDWDFENDCPEKFDDPDEYGNHYGHWPIDPKDYL